MVQSPLNSYGYSIVANIKPQLGQRLAAADHNLCKLAGLIPKTLKHSFKQIEKSLSVLWVSLSPFPLVMANESLYSRETSFVTTLGKGDLSNLEVPKNQRLDLPNRRGLTRVLGSPNH